MKYKIRTESRQIYRQCGEFSEWVEENHRAPEEEGIHEPFLLVKVEQSRAFQLQQISRLLHL